MLEVLNILFDAIGLLLIIGIPCLCTLGFKKLMELIKDES